MKIRYGLIFIIFILAVALFPMGAAASEAEDINGSGERARILNELGLFQGEGVNSDGTINFALDKAPTRVESLVMLIRLLGKESEALSAKYPHPFTDVADWADPYIGYAYKNALTDGVSPSRFGSNLKSEGYTYLTFMLRALGYKDGKGGDFVWDKPYGLAQKAGIMNQSIDTKNFLRADAVTVSSLALSAKLKDEDITLADSLIDAGVFTEAEYNEAFHLHRNGQNWSYELSGPSSAKEPADDGFGFMCFTDRNGILYIGSGEGSFTSAGDITLGYKAGKGNYISFSLWQDQGGQTGTLAESLNEVVSDNDGQNTNLPDAKAELLNQLVSIQINNEDAEASKLWCSREDGRSVYTIYFSGGISSFSDIFHLSCRVGSVENSPGNLSGAGITQFAGIPIDFLRGDSLEEAIENICNQDMFYLVFEEKDTWAKYGELVYGALSGTSHGNYGCFYFVDNHGVVYSLPLPWINIWNQTPEWIGFKSGDDTNGYFELIPGSEDAIRYCVTFDKPLISDDGVTVIREKGTFYYCFVPSSKSLSLAIR